MSVTEVDFYELLGVERSADGAAIKAAYRSGLKQVHPDVGGTTDGVISLTEAYQVLADPDQRAAYDRALRARGGAMVVRSTRWDDDDEFVSATPQNPLFGRPMRAFLALSLAAGYVLSSIH